MRLFHLLSLPVSVFFEAEREWGNCRFILTLSLFFFFFNFTKRGIWRGWESRSRPLFLSYQLFSFFFLLLLFISPSFSRNRKGKKKKNEEPKAHLTFFLFYFIVASIPITLGEIKTGKEAKDEQRWQSLYKGASNVELVVVIRHYFPPALFFFFRLSIIYFNICPQDRRQQ